MRKQKHTERLLGLLGLAGTVGALVPTTTVHAAPEVDVSSELDAFWESMDAGNEDEAVTRSMLSENEERLIKLSSKISDNMVEQEKLEESIKEKEQTIEETEAEIQTKIELHNRRKEQAAGQAVSLQTRSQGRLISLFEMVINSDGLSDALGRMQAVSTLSEANGRTMELLQEEQIKLEELGEQLKTDKENLEVEKTQLTDIRKELETQKEEAEKLQEAMEKKFEKQEEERARLEAEQARLLEIHEQQLENERKILESLQESDVRTYTSNQTALRQLASRKSDPLISQQVVSNALSYMGVPYVWGGSTPSGFDCSGLTQYVFREAGISLPRTAAMQSTQGSRVAFNDLEPGDLLFWGAEGNSYHVGIYVGGGKMIHAPKPGDSVKIIRMEHFMPDFAKRVIPDNSLNLTEATTLKVSDRAFKSSEMVDSLFNATYYSAYDGAQIGITAGGTNMANGNVHTKDGYRIIAVDPKVIPMGTIMRVTTGDGQTFLGKADDTGGVIKGNKIDIAVSSASEAMRMGRTTAVVEILK